jgi:TolB-like protein
MMPRTDHPPFIVHHSSFIILLGLLLPLCLISTGCSYNAPLRVAVINFENSTGDSRYDFLEQALPEYIIARLSNTDVAVILERQAPRVWGDERGKDEPADQWLARTRRHADYFITGSVSRLERNFIVTARLSNARDEEVIPGTAVTQTCIHEHEIYSRVQSIAQFLAAQLRARGVITPLSEADAKKSNPVPKDQIESSYPGNAKAHAANPSD